MPGEAVVAPPAARAASPPSARLAGSGDTLLLIVAGVLAWAALSAWAGSEVLTGPTDTVVTLFHLFGDADFATNLWATLRAFVVGLAIAWVGGVLGGLILGAHRLTGEVAEPIVTTLYSIPKITLYPVVLLLFGLGISARIAFGAIHGIIPVMLFTMAAVRGIRPIHFRTARAMNLGWRETAWKIVFPSCLPGIVSGLRIGFSLTLLGTLIGEMFAAQAGLGRMTIVAMQNDDVRVLMALALLLFTAATLTGGLLLALDRRLSRRLGLF